MPVTTEQAAKDIIEGAAKPIRVDEVLERLGISRSTLERWIRNKGPSKHPFPSPIFYIGEAPCWVAEQLVEWLQKSTHGMR